MDLEESITDFIMVLNQKDQNSVQQMEVKSQQKEKLNIVPTLGPIRYLKFRAHQQFQYQSNDSGYYYKFLKSDVSLIRNVLEDNGFSNCKDNDWTLCWSCGSVKYENFQQLGPYQKINHFPNTIELTRKDAMYKNIARMQSQHGIRNFNFVPTTYIIPQDIFLLKEQTKQKTYILKPSAKSQGKGIKIIDDITEIIQKKNTSCILSEYIDNPYLINGLKFDLRIYVCLTCINPLRVYVYNEGLVRFATSKYTNDINDKFVHLTNYSVNKYSENFVQNADLSEENHGHKWSLSALKKYFQDKNISWDTIQSGINDILIKSLLSIEQQLFQLFEQKVPYKNNCFEILGFDVLLDSTLKPWLLEVNLSPSMACDSPLDQKIKSQLIADTFTMIGIVPLDQRLYQNLAFNSASKNVYEQKVNIGVSMKPSFSTKKKQDKAKIAEPQNKDQKIAIKETQEEFKRKQNYTRIYPSANSQIYNQFFQQKRELNQVVFENEFCLI